MAYINTKTKQYPVTEQDIRNEYSSTAFPFPFVAPEEYAVVFPTPQPEGTVTQGAFEIAPELTDKGVYEQRWEVRSRFQEYTDAEGVVHTVAEQEAAAIAADESTKKAANAARAKQLLLESDFAALVDVRATLTNVAEFDTYRAALRAIVTNPPVTVEQWPERPDSVWSA